MNRWKALLAALVAVATAFAPGLALAGPFYYWFQVEDEYGRQFTADYAVGCTPYVAGTGTVDQNVYTDATLGTRVGAGTHAGVLYSNTSGIVHFWASSDTTYDVACFSRFGGSGRVPGLGKTHHRVPLKTDGTVVTRFPWGFAPGGAASRVTIPFGAIIRDVIVQTQTSFDGAHINVGVGGNAVWSLDAQLVHQLAVSTADGAAVFQRPHVVIGADGVRPYVSAVHRGTAISIFRSGNPAGQAGSLAGAHIGLYSERPAIVHNAAGFTLTYSTSSGGAGIAPIGGHVYVIFDQPIHAGAIGSPVSIFGR